MKLNVAIASSIALAAALLTTTLNVNVPAKFAVVPMIAMFAVCHVSRKVSEAFELASVLFGISVCFLVTLALTSSSSLSWIVLLSAGLGTMLGLGSTGRLNLFVVRSASMNKVD